MGWKRVDVVFTLKAPLHIGYVPSKATVMAPTRYYITGRNLWGALTKRATENLFRTPKPRCYQEVGEKIRKSFRSTCFFVYDDEMIYVPVYTGDGLKYGDKNQVSASEFEHRFISSIILTAIGHRKGTAEDESLHEIEFLKDTYLDEKSRIRSTKLIGCIWIKDALTLPSENGEKEIKIYENGIFVDDFDLIGDLSFGGEQNYGFGSVQREFIGKGKFKVNDNSNENVQITIEKNDPIFFHLEYDKDILFEGDIELLSGREYPQDSVPECFTSPGSHSVKPRYFFSPGTLIKIQVNCILTEAGTAKVCRMQM